MLEPGYGNTGMFRGRLLCCVGGKYKVFDGNSIIGCEARGIFRHNNLSPVAGDEVICIRGQNNENTAVINEVLPRKNLLPRPPVSNIDVLFIVCASSEPEPSVLGIDKLTVIAAHLSIKPILIINKTEINPVKASELFDIYSFSGINTFLFQENTHDEVKAALLPLIEGNVCTFAGESGVGKSTLLNSLFGEDISKTSVLSDKSKRGRQTTRESVLYPISFCKSPSFLADTPGFSLLDFEKNSFVDKYELAQCFSDFISFTDKCKYNKCSHTVEEGCAVLEAVREGKIKKTRHESYMYLYNCVKNFKPWEKRS